jgi:hypothetical protein
MANAELSRIPLSDFYTNFLFGIDLSQLLLKSCIVLQGPFDGTHDKAVPY